MQLTFEMENEVKIAPKDMVGIYAIMGKYNGKHYVGQADNKLGFYGRFREHRTDLRGDAHGNQFLQNSYNKHGENQFIFKILEICDKNDNLNIKEGYWINKLESMYFEWGWNLDLIDINGTKIRSYHSNLNHPALIKAFKVLSPEGKIIEDKNMAKFSKENNLNPSSFNKLINGQFKQYKGFKSLHSDVLEKESKIHILIGPDNNEYKFNNILQFSIEHGLSDSDVSGVLNSKVTQTKGWKLPRQIYENNTSSILKKIINLNTLTEHHFYNTAKFCQKYNLDYKNIFIVINYNYKNYKNFGNVNKRFTTVELNNNTYSYYNIYDLASETGLNIKFIQKNKEYIDNPKLKIIKEDF